MTHPFRLKYGLIRPAFLAAGFFYGFLFPAVSFSDEFADLKAQVQAIQKENKDLREQLDHQSALNQKQVEMIQRLLDRMTAIEKTEGGEQAFLEEPLMEDAMAVLPKVDIKGFADIRYTAQDEVNAAEVSANTFTVGEFDLFFVSNLTDELSALAEMAFEFEGDNNAEVDPERIILKYALSDLLNVEIGRMHTPLGFWNTAYHHGAWLQTTVARPLMVEWEHDGGILPVHMVGVKVGGMHHLEKFVMNYSLAVVNGRGETVSEIQSIQDGNDAKAFVMSVGMEPEAISGLEFGGGVYVDRIPPNTALAARSGEIEELILSGHAVYHKERIELLAEGVYMLHDDEVSGVEYHTHGVYLQGACQFDKWKPYYRWEHINFDEGDPYFASVDIDNVKHLTGLRWDPFSWNALKMEYSYQERENEDDIHMVQLQSSYTF